MSIASIKTLSALGKNGTLFLYDSNKEYVIETTLKEVNNLYHEVYGLYLFLDIDSGAYAFI